MGKAEMQKERGKEKGKAETQKEREKEKEKEGKTEMQKEREKEKVKMRAVKEKEREKEKGQMKTLVAQEEVLPIYWTSQLTTNSGASTFPWSKFWRNVWRTRSRPKEVRVEIGRN